MIHHIHFLSNDLEGTKIMRFQKKTLLCCFVLVFFLISTALIGVLTVSSQVSLQHIKSEQNAFDCTKLKVLTGYDIETYNVPTSDDSSVTLTRYKGNKNPDRKSVV